jgi:GNAT superfamily N-acetyltransferase
MAEIREIMQGQTRPAGEAMLMLRPRWATTEAVVTFIDSCLRPAGYRLAGVFEDESASAVSVIGFREQRSTAWGHYMYIDDLSTVVAARGHGYADALTRWVIAEAQRRNCEAVHLDSGVGSHRAPAHRLYMRNGMQISAHHFLLGVQPD